MAEKKSELQKLSDWMSSWGPSLYERTTGKPMPQKPERESLAPAIYKKLTGRNFPTDPEPVIKNRTVSDEGLMDFGVGGKRIVAPKNGVMGYMIPGKPDSWVADGDKIGVGPELREKAKARYAKATGGKTAAPPKAADSRLDSPIAGPGPKGNEVGSDSDPDEPGLQGPGDPKGPATGPVPTTERTNANGLKSYGRDLSSLNTFTKAFTGGYEVADIQSAFQSNDLPTAYQNGSNKISTEETPYELPKGSTPSNVGGKYTMGSGDISIENTGYKINPSSVPGTVGGNPSDPQDGTSDKPDVADNIRTVRMRRKGPRDDGGPRGFAIDQANEFAQNSVSETKGNGMNAKRRAIRSTFLDHEGSSVQAIAAANAVAGYGKDSDGNARFNYGGELVYAKDGMQQKAKNAAMLGQDPTQFLDIPATGDTQPDTPAASELSPVTASTVKPGTIEMPENKGGSIDAPTPIIQTSPEKFQEAQNFMSSKRDMLTRRTK